MIKSAEVYEKLKKYAIFDNKITNNLINKNQTYNNLFNYRLKKSFKIFRIEKNRYTFYNDPFLISSRIIWPSYISCLSALNFYKMTAQTSNRMTIIAVKNKKPIRFSNTIIEFIKIKNNNFFGFEKIKYNNFEIFIADKEKSLIDSVLLKKVSFSEIKDILCENIKTLNVNKIIRYLKKINNSSLTKRIGFLLEGLNYDVYGKLKDNLDLTCTKLDYTKLNKGKKNNKWKLIIND